MPRAPREIGILMSGPMVVATIERRKTQTRRLPTARNDYIVGDRLWVRETHAIEADGRVVYAADRAALDRDGDRYYLASNYEPAKWRPSLFLPRNLCRLVLGVTAVRLEQLHEITEADAIAEGVRSRAEYRELWHELHGADWSGAWAANPIVRVVTFTVLENAYATSLHR